MFLQNQTKKNSTKINLNKKSDPKPCISRLIYTTGLFFFIPCIILCYWIARLQHSALISRTRDQVTIEIDHIRNNLSRDLHSSINLTQGLFTLISTGSGVQKEQFEFIAHELTENNSLIINIALAPNNIIQNIYPLYGNEKALGLDYLKTPSQATAVLRAMKEKRTIVAGPVNLVQGGVGIIGRTPIFIYNPDKKETTSKYWGMASTVINFNSLIQSTGITLAESKLKLALRGEDGTGEKGNVFWGDTSVISSNPVLMEIPLPSGSWQLAATPLNGWPSLNLLTSRAFLIGLLISFFFSILLIEILYINNSRGFEIRLRKITEETLKQKNRALKLFSQCNAAIIHSIDENILLQQICKLAVESAGYRMAWIGKAENDDNKTICPIATAGEVIGLADNFFVSWGENNYGRGSAGTAIRNRKPVIGRDLLTNKEFSAWHDSFVTNRFASVIAVPLIVENTVFGVLLIYASEPDAFDSTEVGLLDDLGKNISYGIMSIRSRKERSEAIAALEQARNELEEKVKERTHELVTAKDAAEASDRLKSAFLATMSHELRTPLNSIIGFTGIILQGLVGDLNDEQKKQLSMVRNSAQHLLALINDILDISKIESGQLELQINKFDLQEAIASSIQVVRPMVEKKALQLLLDSNTDPIHIYSDQRRVEQVLINLINNAVKFTDTGSVTLSIHQNVRTIETPPDAINSSALPVFLLIAIKDTGIGINAEDMPALFQPFRQIDMGTTRKYEGTGLGLSICKKIAHMLGGDITVQSDGAGKGSTFNFLLPLTETYHGQKQLSE